MSNRGLAAVPAVAGDAEIPSKVTIAFIQYIRGVAPLLVMWAHLSGFWLVAHGRVWKPQQFFETHVAIPLGLYQNAGHLGVVLFFFVSGYIVTHSSLRESVPAFGVKRFFRLAPALWVSVLVVVAARSVAHGLGTAAPTGTGGDGLVSYLRGAVLWDMLGNHVQVNAVTWTLVVEVMFYLLTGLLIPLTRRRPGAATAMMLAVWASGALVAHAFAASQQLDYFTIYVGLLILGRAIYLGHSRALPGATAWLLCGLVAAVTVAVYAHCSHVPLFAAGGPANTYFIGLLLFLVAMYAGIRSVPRVVSWLADISYSLYLLHIPVGMLVIDLMLRAGSRFTVAFVVAVVASLVAATLSYLLVERWGQRTARRLVRRMRRQELVTVPGAVAAATLAVR